MGTVDAVRGLAATMVVWFHLTHLDFRFLPGGVIRESGDYGWLGVDIFFVISGFIIPWSLYRAGYTTRSFGRFVARRVIRLDPPYLASMVLVLAIASAAAWLPAGSTRSPITARQVALHFGYLNVMFGQRWLNPVYWTLAIELQWYLLVGAIQPLIAAAATRRRALAMGALCIATLLPELPGAPLRSFLFPFLGFFVIGVAAFQRRAGLATGRGFVLTLAAGAVAATYRVGAVPAAAAVLTATLIAGVDWRPRILAWLGEISYSLYLVHSPVAMLFIRYAVDHNLGFAGRLTMMAMAAGASLGAAWLLWRFVERPAQRWAGSIGYVRGGAAPGGTRITPIVALPEVPLVPAARVAP